MKATRRRRNGEIEIFYALYDSTQSGEYEDDVLRHEWMTEDEAKGRNELLKGDPTHEGLIWVVEDVEPEDHEDTPSLDCELYY